MDSWGRPFERSTPVHDYNARDDVCSGSENEEEAAEYHPCGAKCSKFCGGGEGSGGDSREWQESSKDGDAGFEGSSQNRPALAVQPPHGEARIESSPADCLEHQWGGSDWLSPAGGSHMEQHGFEVSPPYMWRPSEGGSDWLSPAGGCSWWSMTGAWWTPTWGGGGGDWWSQAAIGEGGAWWGRRRGGVTQWRRATPNR